MYDDQLSTWQLDEKEVIQELETALLRILALGAKLDFIGWTSQNGDFHLGH